MATATYSIKVDWNNDGDFSDAGEDISSDVRSISFNRGRDADLEKAEVGKCRITVRDTTGKYVPENTTSPVYPNLLPARPVQIQATFAAVTYDLFYGYLDDIIPDPHPNAQKAFLPCVDGFDQLIRAKVSMALQVDKKSGQLFTTALDAVSWSAARRTLDTGIDTYPLVHAERQPCKDFLQKLETSEFGFVYIGGDGYLNWEDRHHRLKAPHITSQWTATALLYMDIEPTDSLKSVRNKIILTAQPKTKAGALSDIWTLQENSANADSPSLAAGETKTFWASYADANGMPNIAGEVVDTGANPATHYAGNDNIDGSGANRTADVTVVQTTFAASAKLVVTNGGATSLYLTLLKVEGKIYTDSGRLQIESENATSQTKYLKRELKMDLPYYQSTAIMQGMADYQLSIKKDAIPGYRIELANASDAILTQILARKVSDRITLQNTTLNIDDDFHIEKIEHEITEAGKLHKCWWTLSRASDIEYWILGTSALGTGTRLAY